MNRSLLLLLALGLLVVLPACASTSRGGDDGNGLVFGDELEPLVVNVSADMASGTWSVEEANVYVLEVHVPGGDFF